MAGGKKKRATDVTNVRDDVVPHRSGRPNPPWKIPGSDEPPPRPKPPAGGRPPTHSFCILRPRSQWARVAAPPLSQSPLSWPRPALDRPPSPPLLIDGTPGGTLPPTLSIIIAGFKWLASALHQARCRLRPRSPRRRRAEALWCGLGPGFDFGPPGEGPSTRGGSQMTCKGQDAG